MSHHRSLHVHRCFTKCSQGLPSRRALPSPPFEVPPVHAGRRNRAGRWHAGTASPPASMPICARPPSHARRCAVRALRRLAAEHGCARPPRPWCRHHGAPPAGPTTACVGWMSLGAGRRRPRNGARDGRTCRTGTRTGRRYLRRPGLRRQNAAAARCHQLRAAGLPPGCLQGRDRRTLWARGGRCWARAAGVFMRVTAKRMRSQRSGPAGPRWIRQ